MNTLAEIRLLFNSDWLHIISVSTVSFACLLPWRQDIDLCMLGACNRLVKTSFFE